MTAKQTKAIDDFNDANPTLEAVGTEDRESDRLFSLTVYEKGTPAFVELTKVSGRVRCLKSNATQATVVLAKGLARKCGWGAIMKLA